MRAEASLLMAVVAASPVAAACVCTCQDGRNRPVCDDPAEIAPVCPPDACAAERPSTLPDSGRRIRPLGTASCALTRVYDQATGNFQWVRLCN